MFKRSKPKQTEHDRKVRSLANGLKKKKYKVEADVTGFKEPRSIGKNNRIPDIVASKGGRKRIIEVETPSSMKTDKGQHSTFRRSAAQRKNTTFRIEVTDKRKR